MSKVRVLNISRVLMVLLLVGLPILSRSQQQGDEDRLSEGPEPIAEKELDFSAFIQHHIADDYLFHIAGDIAVPLPVIIYESGKGFDMFLSSAFHHTDENHLSRGRYLYHHGKLFIPDLNADGTVQMGEDGHLTGKHEATLGDLISGNKHVFYNFSITKNVFGLLLGVSLLMIIFFSVASKYKSRPNQAPKGFQGMMEVIILFIQNDVARPFITEKKVNRFLPYLLTLFFFILINNLLGLIPIFPGSANVTGNIAITMSLAVLSLLMVIINGNKHFWGHIINPPGVPLVVKFLLVPIELIGIVTKSFSLMIRLFANITAGHIIIMSIIGITFIIQSYAVGIVTSLFSVAMFTLEVLVAFIQAFIFTLLTAQMIGQAVDEGHHAEVKSSHH